MDHFNYTDGVLFAEGVDTRALADRFHTPLYVYSTRTLIDHYDRIANAFADVTPNICYSVKSCSNLEILRLLKGRGAWFDVVSGGELARVLEIGADPARVVFAGVGKTDEEILAALRAGISRFNVESPAELANISGLSAGVGCKARVSLRVNPNVDAKTHEYTTTGVRETKFGIDHHVVPELFAKFSSDPNIELSGLHVHIGSPVNSVDPYVRAIERVLVLARELNASGSSISEINIGGGFGAHYDGEEAPPATTYAAQIVPMLKESGLSVAIEPGRSISANAGILLTKVLYTKTSGRCRFAVVDASMTDLIRPALYSSFHFVWPASTTISPPARSADLQLPETMPIDIVGPVCETGDFLARERHLPPLARGDLLCVFSAGAYGFSMSSQYNSRPRAAEVLVEGSDARVIRRRETYEDLVAAERA